MPPRFVFPIAAPGADGVVTDIWIHLDPRGGAADRTSGLYPGYARLKPGVTFAAASTEVNGIGAGLVGRAPRVAVLRGRHGRLARGNPSEEEFGDARLKELLRSLAHLDANEIAARLRAELKAWIQDAPQYDDLTFIVMKVRPTS